MAFYENTIVAKQDLAEKELKVIKEKYNELINNSSGKVVKIEEWGLLNLANKIKNYKKGFYIHFKFEGNKDTLNEIEKKIKVDGSIIRYLTVKYKKLDTKSEFFKKDKWFLMKRKNKKYQKKNNNSLSKLSLFQKNDGKFSKKCPLSVKNAPVVDYKNINLLKKYVSDNGKIMSSKITSVSFNKQKKLTKEIKKAKILGLI